MKIALIAPIEETVPPRKYGGTEWIVYDLAHFLGKRGHEVDLYASGDSPKEEFYSLIPIVGKSIRSDPTVSEDMRVRWSVKLLAVAKVLLSLQKNNYDIIHNHISWRLLTFSRLLNRERIITTLHGDLQVLHERIAFNENKDTSYISISNNQQKGFPELNYVSTIYNGIDPKLFPYNEEFTAASEPYMMFLARMSPEKGGIEAAKVALKTKHRLIAAAKIDVVDKEHFEEFKKLLDDNYVSYEGELTAEERTKKLQDAKCLIAPVNWEEPFGLMFIEAMACGTPVVAFARGSVPEVIKDGETGFIVNSSDDDIRGDWIIKKTGIDGLCEAVERIYSMPEAEYRAMRRASRAHVEQNFTVERMVDQYEQVYKKIIEKGK